MFWEEVSITSLRLHFMKILVTGGSGRIERLGTR